MSDFIKMLKAYFLRVDEESGVVYQGYFGLIENTLEAKQKYVNFGRPDGTIQVIRLGELDVIVHDEGKLLNFPLNRVWCQDNKVLDTLNGNILVVRHIGEEFSSIRDSDAALIEKCLRPIKIVGFGDYEFVRPEALPKYKE